MRKLFCAILFWLIFLSSCTTKSHITGIIPVVLPSLDEPFHSISFYESRDNVDIYKNIHNINDEYNIEKEATDLCNKLLSHIQISTTPHKCRTNYELYTRSKKISNNNYYISCTVFRGTPAQANNTNNLESCIQFFIAARLNIPTEQTNIAKYFRYSIDYTLQHKPNDLLDILAALGANDLSVYQDTSHIILESLAKNKPVLIVYKDQARRITTLAVVIGARYSFTSATLPQWPFAGKFAFAELETYDPHTGQYTMLPATIFENNILFIVT